MSYFQAFILGIIQGVTAFFPVSSSGHVSLFYQLLTGGAEISFSTLLFLQIGPFFALLAVFRRDLAILIRSLADMAGDLAVNGRLLLTSARQMERPDYRRILVSSNRRLVFCLLLAELPTALIGSLSYPVLGGQSGSLLLAATGFFFSALILLVSSFYDRGKRSLSQLRWKDGLMIGIFQGLSVIPGISRLAMVSASSDFMGLSVRTRSRLIFLSGIPAIGSALVFGLVRRGWSPPPAALIGPLLAGGATSCLVSLALVRLAVRICRRQKNRLFMIYCILIGVVTVSVYLR